MEHNVTHAVKEHYGKIAAGEGDSCCHGADPGETNSTSDMHAQSIGYSEQELADAPTGANLGLGCGNPLVYGEIRPGDTVLDLGSGGGFDAFLAAQSVGPEGLVIGVDMTPEMIDLANKNSAKAGISNVEFRLGQIENLPVQSASVDLIISNCVINLAPEKQHVFNEAFRVLKSGGVMSISDIVLRRRLPWIIRRNLDAYLACVAGAELKADYLAAIRSAGFEAITVTEEKPISEIFPENDPILRKLLRAIPLPRSMIRGISGRYGASIRVRAVKPAA